jgi:hypothetical protein
MSTDGIRPWDIAQATQHWNSAAVTEFEHYPASALRSIQIIIPDMLTMSHRVREAERLSRMFEGIPQVTAAKLETFSVVLRGQLDRRWGGFGVAGGTTRVNAKTREQAEADLTERARLYMTTPGTSAWVKQREEKEKDVVAKYADKLKAAKPAPAALKTDDDLVAAAVAAISTIQSRDKDKGKGKAVDVPKLAEKGSGPGGKGNGSPNMLNNGHMGKETLDSGIADEDSLTELGDPPRPDKGKGRMLPATLDIATMADGLHPDLKDDADSQIDPDDEVKVEQAENGESSSGPKQRAKRKVRGADDSQDILTDHDKCAINNHLRLEEQTTCILRIIARVFPNLVSLQVVRGGSNRTDVVEGEDSMERMLRCIVEPLKDVDSLRHLDLGLAVVGLREARDFPVGLNVPVVDPVKAAAQYGPTQARSMMLRKRLHETDILKAVKEGDAWRKKVIERFALGRGDPVIPANHGSDAPPKAITWPRGIQSGCVYSPDLIERIKYRGFLMCWEKDMVNGTEVLKWKRRNVIL